MQANLCVGGDEPLSKELVTIMVGSDSSDGKASQEVTTRDRSAVDAATATGILKIESEAASWIPSMPGTAMGVI